MKTEKADIRPFTRQFYRGNTGNFVIAIASALLTAFWNLLVSWLLQQIIDLIGRSEDRLTLSALAVISLVFIVGIAISALVNGYAEPKFITRGISQYKEYVFSELTKKNISAFTGENSAVYISALTNDIEAIRQGYLVNTFSISKSAVTFIGAVALMLYYSPLLTLMGIVLSLLPLTAAILTGNAVAGKETRVSERSEVYSSTLKDSLSGFTVVKAFMAEAQMVRIFKDNVKQLADAQCARDTMQHFVQTLGSIAGVTAQLGVFIFGAWLALSGKGVTGGTVLAFVQLMNYITSPIAVIPACLAQRKAAKALVEKTADALRVNTHEDTESGDRSLCRGITMQDVSFGYAPDQPVLHGVSCSLELGKKYAIVGASGSGKSTILYLLMASHRNYTGSIRYDGTELREIGSSSLYRIESIIQQNVFIFNASIRDNITMFRDFPEHEIREAIRLSGLSELIAQKGLDYLCGENGSGLSGGEKQRISIARCLLRKSQVLLVDEATAALDKETAYQVTGAILGLKGITCIVVTHALDEGLMKQYDEILTLKNGRIVEAGGFDELIREKGYFYSLFTVSQ